MLKQEKFEIDIKSPTFARDMMMHGRQQILDAVAEKEKMLKRLDNEIMDKMAMRTLLIKEMGRMSRPLASFKSFCGCNPDKLMDEWREKHFESAVVQNAVSDLRREFFDDTDPVCQAFDCVDISDPNYDRYIKFTFSNGKLEFSLNIPTTLYEEKYHIDNEVFGGKVNVTYMRSKCYEDSIVSSYDLNVIADSIKVFMYGKFVPIEHGYTQYSFIDTFHDSMKVFHSYGGMYACDDDD